MRARDRLIVALDYPSRLPALALVEELADTVLWYKVGLELYLAEGAPLVSELVASGKSVFLDLKLHDIPNTVAGAVRSAARTGASLLTVHAAGGPAMLRAAVEAAGGTQLKVLAVTVLTSMDDIELATSGVDRGPAAQVGLLGAMAIQQRITGLVCSPEEVPSLRASLGSEPMLVVPGIRSANAPADDQRRTASAGEAISRGASQLVVGRPITRATDPMAAARAILREIEAAQALSRT